MHTPRENPRSATHNAWLQYLLYFTFKKLTPTIGGITQGPGTPGFSGLLYSYTCTGAVATSNCTLCCCMGEYGCGRSPLDLDLCTEMFLLSIPIVEFPIPITESARHRVYKQFNIFIAKSTHRHNTNAFH